VTATNNRRDPGGGGSRGRLVRGLTCLGVGGCKGCGAVRGGGAKISDPPELGRGCSAVALILNWGGVFAGATFEIIRRYVVPKHTEVDQRIELVEGRSWWGERSVVSGLA